MEGSGGLDEHTVAVGPTPSLFWRIVMLSLRVITREHAGTAVFITGPK